MTIRQKLFLAFLSFAIILIFSCSGIYYYLLFKDIRQSSRRQIGVAFDLIFSELQTKNEQASDWIAGFHQDALATQMYILSISQQQYGELNDAQNWEYWRSLEEILSRLSRLAEETQSFGELIAATEIRVYNQQKQLLAVYQGGTEGETRQNGIYLTNIRNGTFLPFSTLETNSNAWQQIDDIPVNPLPDGLLPIYAEEFPEAPQVEFSTLRGKVMLQFTTPILRKGNVCGVSVVSLGFRTQDVERYSRLSQTRVNIFAGTHLSVGTLSDYTTFELNSTGSILNSSLAELEELPPFHFSSLSISDQRYYQGIVRFGSNAETGSVAFTANFPRHVEVEKGKELFFLISSVSLGLTLLMSIGALVFSRTITKPITALTTLSRQITEGNLAEVLQYHSQYALSTTVTEKVARPKDEIKLLWLSFSSMVDYLQEIATVAQHISQGDISRTMTPRSSHDLLGNAFHQMSLYLHEISAVATAVADGDLRQTLQPRSEHDVLGTAIHKFSELRDLIRHILKDAQKIRLASEHLSHISANMAVDAEQAFQKVNTVSASSQQISASVREAASAIEELSASSREIAENTGNVADRSSTALDITHSASKIIDDLNTHSEEIGDIVQVITSITQQTNLLALNATIEAARAGESGKGFAVVAGEVKALAKEIASSATHIRQKIEMSQAGIEQTAGVFRDVLAIVKELRDISGMIADGTKQQTVASNSIAHIAAEAAEGSNTVSHAIAEVSGVTQNTHARAAKVQTSANYLSQLSDQLQKLVERFQIE